ncbi:MBL fold metallo-hydrolase [Candidatus Thorarchaeota archaeon]|nr:MAG: MBL fold metallo-hydrolase [Candidatus Thorarchaeota archaeon]
MKNLDCADEVVIRLLVDNKIGWISDASHPSAKRAGSWVDSAEATPHYLVAGHGFSALMEISKDERRYEIVYDTGPSDIVLSNNVGALGIDVHGVDSAVLSHGHWDHFGGLLWLLERVKTQGLPVYIHPRMFLPKSVHTQEDGNVRIRELDSIPSRDEILEHGGTLMDSSKAKTIHNDLLLISGEVPRRTPYETGFPGHHALVNGKWEDDHSLIEDQFVAAKTKNGLVIVTGCSHAGIVNMVTYAMELTGDDKVAGIIGGFHLARKKESTIESTVHELKEVQPTLVAATHCTGWKAQQSIKSALGTAAVYSSVGDQYTFN